MASAGPYSAAFTATTTGVQLTPALLGIDAVGQGGQEWIITIRPPGAAVRIARATGATYAALGIECPADVSTTLPDYLRRDDISSYWLVSASGTVACGVSAQLRVV